MSSNKVIIYKQAIRAFAVKRLEIRLVDETCGIESVSFLSTIYRKNLSQVSDDIAAAENTARNEMLALCRQPEVDNVRYIIKYKSYSDGDQAIVKNKVKLKSEKKFSALVSDLMDEKGVTVTHAFKSKRLNLVKH